MAKVYKIAVIKGDGIGPEIVDEAIKVLDALASICDFDFRYNELLMGGNAYDITGDPLPQETIDGCKEADAILFGAIGGEKWDNLPREKRPESGLLRLRSELDLYANYRPVKVYDELVEASTLKKEVVEGGDLLVMRELTGGSISVSRVKKGRAKPSIRWSTAKRKWSESPKRDLKRRCGVTNVSAPLTRQMSSK